MATQEQKTQIYEGILYKQGKISTSWKERFFVLYSDRTLAYFKSEEDWDEGKPLISYIDLSLTRSIAPTNKKIDKSDSVEKQMKKVKSRRGSLSRKWSIDFSAIFSNKGGKDDQESDEDNDGEIMFIELVLNKQFTFEIVQAKRTYNLCTDDPTKFNKWLNKLEVTTFGKKLHKGWLLKQSERNKKWDKRWFIIYDTREMRYYDDATRAVSRGMAVLSQLKKITKMDDEKAKKKFKQTNVLKLEFKQRTLLLSCSPSDDRVCTAMYPCTQNMYLSDGINNGIQRVWFDKICRVVGKNAHFVSAIYDDYLYKYDEKSAKWKKYWFLLDKDCLLQFRDMDHCDEYCKHGYFDDKEHNKAFSRYVQQKINLSPFDPKNVLKIRPGSNLQKKLIKECIFVILSKELGKLFFATENQSQLNRWFKKIRSLSGDEIERKKQEHVDNKIIENPQNWICNVCTFSNNIENKTCEMCQIGARLSTQPSTITSTTSEKKSMDNDNDYDDNEVALWLRDVVKYPQYISLFMDEGYDELFTIKESLTEQDLIEIGIDKRGHRKKIMVFVKRLRDEDDNINHNNDNVQQNNLSDKYVDNEIEGANVMDTALCNDNDNLGIVGVYIQDTAK